MAFDVHGLDGVDPASEEGDALLDEYIPGIEEEFAASDEFRALATGENARPEHVDPFITFGFRYLGEGLPGLSVHDVDEILTEIFPRKVSFFDELGPKTLLPEILALWRYLHRRYELSNAELIIDYLERQDPDEVAATMQDPSKFGMAKAFVTAGTNMGFDMTDEAQAHAFQAIYNMGLNDGPADGKTPPADTVSKPGTAPKRSKNQKKKKRKMARSARKSQARKRKGKK
ncbi:MAG: hypothetical protein ACOCZ9_03625 [Spirochaetota bacterium]